MTARRWWQALWNLVRRRRLERDLDDEVGAMYALLVDEQTRAGQPPAAARRAAALALDGVEPLKATLRDARSGATLDAWWQDIKYGTRTLRRTPGFTLTAVLTLALGIGANTTIFTLLDAVLFKPVPVPAASELLTLYENAPNVSPDVQGGAGRYLRFSYPRFQRFERALGSIGTLAAMTRGSRFVVRTSGDSEGHRVRGQLVSGRFFEAMGVVPARGRLLVPADLENSQVAVVSDRFWRNTLGGADDVTRQRITVNGLPLTVVGVTPPGFFGLWTDAEADLWLPLSLQQPLRYDSNVSSYENPDRTKPWMLEERLAWLNVVARVRAPDQAAAAAALQAANREGVGALAAFVSDAKGREAMLAHTLGIEPASRGFSGLRTRYGDLLVALAAMVGIVLLVMCANIANLLLARAAGRARDVGMRISLGATPARLVRQCLTESALLAVAGGVIGVAAGEWMSRALAAQVLGTRTLPAIFTPDLRVAVFGVALSLATSLLFGIGPALRVARLGRGAALASNQRQAIGRSTIAGMRPLVTAQLALATAVVFAAMLLGRTLVNVVRIDPGFDAAQLVTATFDPETAGYAGADLDELARTLVSAMRTVPQVRSSALAACGLMASCSNSSGFVVEGAQGRAPIAEDWVGPGFFATVGIGRIAGREFTDRDGGPAPRVAIVNEMFARKYFPETPAVGRRIGFSALDTEIVGVVADARVSSLHAPPVPMVYFPISQREAFRTSPTALEIAVAGDPTSALPAIREALRRAAPRLPIDGLDAKSAALAADVRRERSVAQLAFAFAGLALLLAAVGLYGVLALAVVRRTPEIGVRVALGANPFGISMLVIRDALFVVLGGAAAGVVLAICTARLLTSLLFDVSPMDPVALVLVLIVLAVVAVAAAYLPARRAARVDPVIALRWDV